MSDVFLNIDTSLEMYDIPFLELPVPPLFPIIFFRIKPDGVIPWLMKVYEET
jgi:hypothetical protein